MDNILLGLSGAILGLTTGLGILWISIHLTVAWLRSRRKRPGDHRWDSETQVLTQNAERQPVTVYWCLDHLRWEEMRWRQASPPLSPPTPGLPQMPKR